MVVHFRLFEKFVRVEATAEIGFADELIIFAFNLAGAWGACRTGNGVDEIGGLPQRIAQRRFTGSRWSGDNEEDSAASELITQRFEFAPEFFPVPPCCALRNARQQRRSISRPGYSTREKFPG